MNPQEIVNNFVTQGFPHNYNIPGNRVFLTDSTVSTIVLAQDRVVIEYYFLLPNVSVPLHRHPFQNQTIFLSGELTGLKRNPGDPTVYGYKLQPSDMGVLGPLNSLDCEHGFITGSKGAVIYNIQVWPTTVANPLSAALEYIGPAMGPLHALQL